MSQFSPEDGNGMFIRNAGIFRRVYTAKKKNPTSTDNSSVRNTLVYTNPARTTSPGESSSGPRTISVFRTEPQGGGTHIM